MAAPVNESAGQCTSAEPRQTVRRFLDAVLWAEHVTVWELLTPDAREVALRVAARRGLDAVAAERARQGTWTDTERDALLGALVRGLSVDLSGADLDEVDIGPVVAQTDGRVIVELAATAPLADVITAGRGWPICRVVLAPGSTNRPWLVDRIVR